MPDRPSTGDDGMQSSDSRLRQRLTLRRFVGVMLAVYWGVLFLATHIPFSSKGPSIPGADKMVHFVGYGALGMLVSLWVAFRRPLKLTVVITIVSVISLYGIIDELLQIPVGRDCELMDWVADIVGASFGVGLITWLSRSRQ